MLTPDQYELIDFGNGRKLERFGRVVVDRPSPPASQTEPRYPSVWKTAGARFERSDAQSGCWNKSCACNEDCIIRHEALTLELRFSDSGAIGVYPEQAENWDWLVQRVRCCARPPSVLNLFGYTGASTLAAAAAGAHVTHVDAARSVVVWARDNAARSGLRDAPIRWIVEDAVRYARRERKRERHYEGIILDPPTYGHGPNGQPWKIDRHLAGLLKICRDLLTESPAFVLLTCHAMHWEPADLEAMLTEHVFGHCQSGACANRLFIRTQDGRRLSSGLVARWPG